MRSTRTRRLALAARQIGTRRRIGTDRLDAGCLDLVRQAGEIVRQRLHRHLLAGQLLDVLQVRTLVVRAESDGDAARTRARGAADAVDVLFRDVGQFEVDDVADARHVDAARRDVGCDQHLGLAVLELTQRALALALALVTVDRISGDAVAGQQLHDAIGAMLGAREDQRAVDRRVLQGDRQQRLLLRLIDEGDVLIDALCGGRGGHDRHRLRLVQELVGQFADRGRHRCREEQGLTLARDHPHDLLECVDESQIHHLVSFVENQNLDHRQVAHALFDEVDQAARRGDQDVDTAAEVLAILVDAGAAEYGGDRQLAELAIAARIVGDLAGEFTGRGQDEHAAMRRQHALLRRGQALDRRQHEGRGLAGAGLRDAEQIAAFEQDRDRLRLDRGGGGIALGFERTDERLGKAEVGE